MKLLTVSESPLHKVGADYHAVDTWIRFPLFLSQHCEQGTLLCPVSERDPGSGPTPDSWRVDLGSMRIAHLDDYNSFVSYYKLWPRRVGVWRRLIDQLVQEHDVVMLRVPSPSTPIVMDSARRWQKPLVVMVTGNLETQSERLRKSRGLKRLLYQALVNRVVATEVASGRQAARIYAYSAELAERHAGQSAKVRMMRTPHVTLADFVERTDTCQSDEVRLLRVSWLLPSKGLDTLLRATALLHRQGLKVRLEVVGKERFPGYQAELEALAAELGIRDRVTFTGWVPFDRIHEPYLRNDIQVISSLSEGTPRCIVEGFARGLPLVSTAVDGCADTLTHEETALMVPPGEPAPMAAVIERVIRDGDLRRRLIRNGYEAARQVTFEHLGLRFLDELRELVPSAASRVGGKEARRFA